MDARTLPMGPISSLNSPGTGPNGQGWVGGQEGGRIDPFGGHFWDLSYIPNCNQKVVSELICCLSDSFHFGANYGISLCQMFGIPLVAILANSGLALTMVSGSASGNINQETFRLGCISPTLQFAQAQVNWEGRSRGVEVPMRVQLVRVWLSRPCETPRMLGAHLHFPGSAR